MRMWMFLCDDNTQFECWERNLFGVQKPYPLEVKKGDFCLLYNYSTKFIFGIWKAISNGRKFIDPDAWGGQYPFQVKVKLVSNEKLCVPFFNIKRLILDESNRIYNRIPESKAHEILELFAFDYGHRERTGQDMEVVEEDYRNRYQREFQCSDGHWVRSQGEQSIDEWLSTHKVYHEYERLTNLPERLIPDFTVYNKQGFPVFIEFWGLIDDPQYNERLRKKCNIYHRHGCKLIELDRGHLKNLDFYLQQYLNKCNIKFED